MISLDQVFLLEQKVESAVEKIQQLQAENDALRSKCLELTNALSSKSEQLSSFENDQTQIEDGIKKALERLSTIENSVLRKASSVPSFQQMESAPQEVKAPAPAENPLTQKEENPLTNQNTIPDTGSTSAPETSSLTNTAEAPVEKENEEFVVTSYPVEEADLSNEMDQSFADDENQDGLGFDIF